MKYLIKESQLNLLSEETTKDEFIKKFLMKKFPDEIFKVVISPPYKQLGYSNQGRIEFNVKDIIVIVDTKDLMNMTSIVDTHESIPRKIDLYSLRSDILDQLRIIGIKPEEFASPWRLKVLEIKFV